MSDDDVTPQDDDQEPPPSEEESEPAPAEEESEPAPAEDESEPAPAGEEPEPPPAGEEPEPPPAGEEPEPAPSGEEESEPEPAPSDSSSSSGKKHHHSSDSDDSDSSSSSDDSSSDDGVTCMDLSEDDIQSALTSAFQERNVPVDDDGVKVTTVDGMFNLMVRLTADAMPLPQVPEDTSNLAPGSVQGAQLMVIGAVQRLDGGTRVTMRVIKVETSEILQAGKGDAMGTANKDAVQAAAEDALAGLDMLHTQ